MAMLQTPKEKKIACSCCGAQNSSQNTFCSRCHTPVELSRSVASRGTEPNFLSVLGSSGAGKTVYLGLLLDILSKGIGEIQGLPNGSFSVAMQQETVTALQNNRFPEKTASDADAWRWVHCEVTHTAKRDQFLDLVTPDLAGEAIALEVEHRGTYPAIERIVQKSSALIVLIDSQQARDASRDEDFFAMKLFSYLVSVHGQDQTTQATKRPPKKNKKSQLSIPISIVFTKSDICPEAMKDPVEFANSNLPGLVRFCERNISDFKFFAASVVGSSAILQDDGGFRTRIPLHVEPHGIIEPLEWIIHHI